jgi:hypothetical protein
MRLRHNDGLIFSEAGFNAIQQSTSNTSAPQLKSGRSPQGYLRMSPKEAN